jgi:putative effector of murein hydrolase LrgA (UPF0299 family)
MIFALTTWIVGLAFFIGTGLPNKLNKEEGFLISFLSLILWPITLGILIYMNLRGKKWQSK